MISKMKTINIDNKTILNKLVIDEDSYLKINISNLNKNFHILIGDNLNVKIFVITKNTSNNIEYSIGQNSNVIVDKFAINTNDKVCVNLEKENANIVYNTGIITNSNSEYKQVINHNYKNTESKIVNHALNVANVTFKFIVDGIIERNANDSILNQDNKIINLKSGKSFIEPNLIIDNNEVIANHSAYIGNFDEQIKFYMMSRGIKEKDTYDLLIKSFLLSEMSLYQTNREELLNIIESEKEGYIE